MNISRFFGSTNREALRQVRLALGPDALIVSNRRVNGGVEILAADPTFVAQQGAQASSPPAVNSATPELMHEIGAMRGALERRMDDLLWGNQLKQSSQAATIFQALLRCGFSTALLRAMLKQLPARLSTRGAQEWVRSELIRNLPVLQNEDTLWQPGRTLALVGPTGVGKTTTIAKLAARVVKRHGSDSLALLTTDTYRIGAYEQLKIYGELLKVPVKIIHSAQELTAVLRSIPSDVTVLIDNVGVSQRDRYVAEQTAMLTATERHVTRLLVLNASSHGDTLDEVARRYSTDDKAPLQGCIVTKADEASSLGAVLDTAIRYRLPIHYVSTGQKVPEDLDYLSADRLVDKAMVLEQKSTKLYAPSQADLAALMAIAEPANDGINRDSRGNVDHLLTVLLSDGNMMEDVTKYQTFQHACAAVEDFFPTAHAWDIWQAFTTQKSGADVETLPFISRMMRDVHTQGGAEPDCPNIVVHGETAMGDTTDQKGVLRLSLLFNIEGEGLASAAQQADLPGGWWSSRGKMTSTGLSARQALRIQILTLRDSWPDSALIHTFEGGSQSLWRELVGENVNWLSRIGTTSRFIHNGHLTTVSALGRRLEHQLLSDFPIKNIRSTPDSGRYAEISVWVASDLVNLRGRGAADAQSLLLVSVRLTDRRTGHLYKQLFGVAHVPDFSVDVAQLAVALVTGYQSRILLRCASRLCSMVRTGSQASQTPLKMLLMSQSVLASWSLMNQPNSIGKAVGYLTGSKTPSLMAFSTALPKLFTLKKWSGDVTGSS